MSKLDHLQKHVAAAQEARSAGGIEIALDGENKPEEMKVNIQVGKDGTALLEFLATQDIVIAGLNFAAANGTVEEVLPFPQQKADGSPGMATLNIKKGWRFRITISDPEKDKRPEPKKELVAG